MTDAKVGMGQGYKVKVDPFEQKHNNIDGIGKGVKQQGRIGGQKVDIYIKVGSEILEKREKVDFYVRYKLYTINGELYIGKNRSELGRFEESEFRRFQVDENGVLKEWVDWMFVVRPAFVDKVRRLIEPLLSIGIKGIFDGISMRFLKILGKMPEDAPKRFEGSPVLSEEYLASPYGDLTPKSHSPHLLARDMTLDTGAKQDQQIKSGEPVDLDAEYETYDRDIDRSMSYDLEEQYDGHRADFAYYCQKEFESVSSKSAKLSAGERVYAKIVKRQEIEARKRALTEQKREDKLLSREGKLFPMEYRRDMQYLEGKLMTTTSEEETESGDDSVLEGTEV
jgi:hypothetical protein